MNVALLKKVRSAILAHPDQFEMKDFFQGSLKLNRRRVPAGGCGTAACIGGWALHLTTKEKTLAESRIAAHGLWVWTDAARVLGISFDEAGALLDVREWPEQFRTRYNKAKSVRPRARAAADRISWFIKTKGAE